MNDFDAAMEKGRRVHRRSVLRQRDRTEERALRLYDQLNPNWETKINVSKAECIKRVENMVKRARR